MILWRIWEGLTMLQYGRPSTPSFQSGDNLMWHQADVVAFLPVIVNETLKNERAVSAQKQCSCRLYEPYDPPKSPVARHLETT